MHNAFTLSSSPIVADLKERVESLLLHGGKLFVGCASGSLYVYSLNTQDVPATATRERVVKQFCKKGIEQLGVIKELNSLVVLSDGVVYLHDLHTLEKQTTLGTSSQTKGQAGIFALDTSFQQSGSQLAPSTKGRDREKTSVTSNAKAKGKATSASAQGEDVPVVVTTLAVGCRRRLVLFTWRDAQWQDPKEISLPHQVRSLAFPLPGAITLGYSTGEYGNVSLPSVTNARSSKAPALSEPFSPDFASVATDAATSASATGVSSHALGAIPGMGTLGGLAAKTGGIMGLGGKLDRNTVVKVKAGEVLAMKESTAALLDRQGKPSRPQGIEYALPPEETVVSWPYILSLLPAPAAVSSMTRQQAQDPLTALPTIHVHSIPNLAPTQAVRVPPLESGSSQTRPISIIDVPPAPIVQAARLLTAGPSGKAPLAVVTHALSDTSTASVSQIHLLVSEPWQNQLDDTIAAGDYAEALALLNALDNAQHVLPEHQKMQKRLRILSALSLFLDKGKYDQAIDIFIEENVNPSKVVSLFPKAISGKLYLDRCELEEVWGGRTREQATAVSSQVRSRTKPDRLRHDTADSIAAVGDEEKKLASTTPPTQAGRFFSASAAKKDDDTQSVRSMLSKRSLNILGRSQAPAGSAIDRESHDDMSYKLSVDVLMRYLPDRRQQFLRALAAIPPHLRPSPNTPMPDHPSPSASDLFAFPDAPLTSYTPAQLQRTAQVVETALFKCYLQAKPGLLGPLCRIDNWCEVEEVEELLLDAKKYSELLDLYNGKGQHEKAIKMLQKMAEESDDKTDEEKVEPVVTYLQKLGSKHLDLIFSASTWVFSLSTSAGLQLFIADMEEVETLPRHAVLRHLQSLGKLDVLTKYLEHIIFSLHEDGPDFHERLAEIYLEDVERLDKSGKGSETERTEAYTRLTDFLETSTQYRADRLLGKIEDGTMFEVRAILLGRLGQHDGALQIYVYKLEDHASAEAYCKRLYNPRDPVKASIFMTLLRVYLQPRKDSTYVPTKATPSKPMFTPALSLLARHGAKMDSAAVLELLPPLLTVQELHVFLQKALRHNIELQHARKVEKRIWVARKDDVERTLVDLEGRRVKITDSRLCPQCHKRLGTSVIAIHAPRGEVTHYQCRDRWIGAKMQTSK